MFVCIFFQGILKITCTLKWIFHLLDVNAFQVSFFVQTLCFIKLIINDFHVGFNKSVEYIFLKICLLPFQVSVVLSFSDTRGLIDR